MNSITYFKQLLDQQLSDQIKELYLQFSVKQSAIDELVERVGISPDFEPCSISIEEIATTFNHLNNGLVMEPRADEFIYIIRSAGDKDFCDTSNLPTGERVVTFQREPKDNRMGFFGRPMNYPNYPRIYSPDHHRLSGRVYRDRAGEYQLLDNRFALVYLGIEPYQLQIESNDDQHIVVITSLFTGQRNCYLLQGSRFSIVKLKNQFCYVRVKDESTEIVHCGSNTLLMVLDNFLFTRAIVGNDFVLLIEQGAKYKLLK